MTKQLRGRPGITPEDSLSASGKEVQTMNIAAGKAVGETVRTTLGPLGMDKMLVDSMGDVVVTNDGATILTEMDIEHPAAKLVVEVAETLEDNVGDGTTSAVTLTGELLKHAEHLLGRNVHATAVARGYRLAVERATQTLVDSASPVNPDDTEKLVSIAKTAISGISAESVEQTLAELVVEAVLTIVEGNDVSTEHVNLEEVGAGTIGDSNLIEGVVIGKERVSNEMPSRIDDARIAVLNTGVEVDETSIDAEITATDPDQVNAFRESEAEQLEDMVSKIAETGVNVLFVRKGIEEHAEHHLAREGIMAIRRSKLSDLEKVQKATGAHVVSDVGDLTEDDLGVAGTVTQKDIGHDERIYIEDTENTKAVTIILRGGTEHTVDELARTMEDCLGAVQSALEDGQILPGGGASEIECTLDLRRFAGSVSGREQLAIEAFADALEVIPRTLAENAGQDPIDTIVSLRRQHDRGDKAVGFDAFTADFIDMDESGIIEPLSVKTQALESATEAAVMTLRVDDVVSANNLNSDNAPPMDGGQNTTE